ncbi:MAG: hypothetical protein Q9225_004428 [Loekoesia sp. 1 TL-2023]
MEKCISDLSQALPGRVFQPEAKEYKESLSSYFSAQESTIKPACIVCPQITADVVTIVSHLVRANQLQGIGSCKFAIRSGGHACFAGSANTLNGITIDLRGINLIKLSEDLSQVSIGTGASWGEVYRTLDPLGLAIPGGRQSQVGVGGLTLGGGLSHFSGYAGLVCDAVTEYEVVLASGNTVLATENDPDYGDLFRALRGGSNNFGIVTRFTFSTFPQGRLWGGTLIYPLETKDQQLQAFYKYCSSPACDPNVSLIHSFGMSAEKGSGFVNSIVHIKPESEPTAIKPFTSLRPTYLNTLRELSLTELTTEQDSFNENGLCQIMIATTSYIDLPLLYHTYDLWHNSCESVKNYAGIVWSMSFQLISPTVIAHSPFLQDVIPTLSTHSESIVVAQLTGTWKNPNDTAALEAIAIKLIDDIEIATQKNGLETGYLYLNYAHAGQNVFGEGERKAWLRKMSRKYDPEGIFQYCVPGGFKLF